MAVAAGAGVDAGASGVFEYCHVFPPEGAGWPGVGEGVAVGMGVAVGSGVAVGPGVAVGAGVFDGIGVIVRPGMGGVPAVAIPEINTSKSIAVTKAAGLNDIPIPGTRLASGWSNIFWCHP
jgi:hypothetical protein